MSLLGSQISWRSTRTYDPFAGAYLQVDPMVPATWSSYGYVSSNPVGQKDPTGLLTIDVSVEGDFGICRGQVNGFDNGSEFDENQLDCAANPTIKDGSFWPGDGPVIDACSIDPRYCAEEAKDWCTDKQYLPENCDTKVYPDMRSPAAVCRYKCNCRFDNEMKSCECNYKNNPNLFRQYDACQKLANSNAVNCTKGCEGGPYRSTPIEFGM
jgi:hypothetical protein